jgi:hypothetical protein
MRRITSKYVPIGGFHVMGFFGNKGDVHIFGGKISVARERAANKEVCTAGSRATEVPPGAEPFPIIRAGDFSDSRPDIFPGTYRATFLEDGTRCIGVCLERADRLPARHEQISLEVGQRYTVRRGAVVSLDGPYELAGGDRRAGWTYFQAAADTEIRATGRVLGIAAWIV